MGKFYCGLCETSHHALIKSTTCSECARIFCVDSIQKSVDAGSYDYPQCDSPLEEFIDIPPVLKERVQIIIILVGILKYRALFFVPQNQIESVFLPNPSDKNQQIDSIPLILEDER